MKINLATGELFTEDGIFLKQLICPKKIRSSQLEKLRGGNLKCTSCDEEIIDTRNLDEEELVKMLKVNPLQCLKVNLNQSNLKIIRNE